MVFADLDFSNLGHSELSFEVLFHMNYNAYRKKTWTIFDDCGGSPSNGHFLSHGRFFPNHPSQIILKPMVLEFPHDLGNLQMGYHLVMTNSSPWKPHPFFKTVNHYGKSQFLIGKSPFLKTVNHLFPWAMA